jgi:AcrR family transcriptional regulator
VIATELIGKEALLPTSGLAHAGELMPAGLTQTGGLREFKKSQTRQLIADEAAELFRAHGFDAVTVDDVARAARVSKKTVFNYFPTKEDLVFDRAEEREQALLAAVRDRAPGVSVVESFRRLSLARLATLEQHRVGHRPGGFFDLIESSPVLQRRAHEVQARLVKVVAQALSEESGAPVGDPVAEAAAEMLLGAQRALSRSLRSGLRGEEDVAAIARRHRRQIQLVFDRLRDGLRNYPD